MAKRSQGEVQESRGLAPLLNRPRQSPTFPPEVLNLSEVAKIALLQEVIRDAKRYERAGFIACIVGIIMAVTGFSTTSLSGNSTYLGIVGLVISAIGFAEFLHYQGVYSKLIGQLASMAFKSAVPCPHCEKELPKGEFDFCPFCGSPLKS